MSQEKPQTEIKTRGGAPVKIFMMNAGDTAPILGAYWTGDEWVPARWNRNGSYPSINEKLATTQLDLIWHTKAVYSDPILENKPDETP